ncbi:MAG: hypothetical protein IT429_10405 [Gemmataceae bacterium]|nr:hypothetical protein [Gemmataceae bacterium]
MKHHSLTLLAACLLLTPFTQAQQLPPSGKPPPDPAGKDAPRLKEAEVRFANGSTVFMAIVHEHIDVMTPFGKLTIPPREIRSIEFGVHLPEGIEAKIDDALKQLSSVSYRHRDGAVRDLVALGPHAYPALHRATRSKEAEVAQRALAAIKLIEGKVPSKQLRLKEEDLIRTTKFTIVGKVLTPAIKAQSEYFGDLTLKPYQLIAIRWLERAGDSEVVVDAARYGSAHNQWLDTGLSVDPHFDLRITATGLVDLWPQGPGQYMASPNGMAGARPNPQGIAGGAPVAGPGVLVGRIGEDGSLFVIGERYAGRPARTGRLYLHIGPSPWNNASTGSYRVRVVSGASGENGN